jgi:syntenin-1
MSLYPTLEDMKVDGLAQAQGFYIQPPSYSQPTSVPALNYPQLPGYGEQPAAYSAAPAYAAAGPPAVQPSGGGFYPTLDDYMGLSLMPYSPPPQQSGLSGDALERRDTRKETMVVAPVSQKNIVGIKRSVIRPGVTEVLLCKDEKGLVGIRIREVNKGCFVQYVAKDSPAAQGGLRFGDQILTINDEVVAGYSTDKVHKLLNKCPQNGIRIAVRERPFERVVTLTKDSGGITGFGFKDGKIVSIVKDSSAARNGLLIDHQLVEVNGQNVIGLKDKVVREMLGDAGDVVTITIMPSFVFDHMLKQMGSSLLKSMDHSVPDC